MFGNMLFYFLLFGLNCYAANIPDSIKMDYGMQLQNAFTLQSEGLSTSAFFHFEQGCEKALKAGESIKKIAAIRQFFVWYRTYGYYLGLMSKNPNICGQYIGSTSAHFRSLDPLNSHSSNNPELKGNRREYLFGVTEILSGILCFWLIPPVDKFRLGIPLVADGSRRVFNAVNYALVQKDVAVLELEKSLNTLKAAAECSTCP